MSDLNSGNNGPEKKEEKNIKKNESLESQLIKGFIGSKVNGGKNKKDKVSFVKGIMSTDSISPALKAELEKYGSERADFDGFKDYDKINITQLQRETRSTFVEINNKKERIKESFLRDYDISGKDYDSKIFKEIDILEEKDLDDLKESQNSRKRLLEKKYGKNKVPQKRDFLKALKTLDFSKRVESKLKVLAGDEHRDLIDLANRYSTLKKLDTVDVMTLFEIGFFTIEEKKDLIKTFMPSINLDKAEKLGIITKEQLEKNKQKYVKYHFFNDENVSNQDIIYIANKLDNADIYISTDTHLVDDSHFENVRKDPNLIYDIGQSISGDIEKGVEEIEKLKEKKDAEKSGKTLEGFQDQLKQLSKVTGAEDFQDGNVIILSVDEKVKGEGGENNIRSTFFWDIKNAGDGTAKVDFVNKGEDVYNSTSQDFSRSYLTLLDFIKDGNPNNNLTVSNFEIITKEELRKRVDSGQMKEKIDELELKGSDYKSEEKDELEKNKLELKDKLLQEGLSLDDVKSNSEFLKIQEEIDDIEEYNLKYLERKINEDVDPKGKDFGIKDNVTFETNKGGIFTIHTVNNLTNEIVLSSGSNVEENISFETFFKTFKELECKRTSNSVNFTDVFNSISLDSEYDDSWKKFKLEGNSIQNKDTDNKIDYEYLVAKEGEEVVKLEDISSGFIKVRFGSYEEEAKRDDKTGDKEKPKKMFSMDSNTHIITAGTLETFIKRYNLGPRSVDEEKDIKNDKIETPDLKGSFWGKLFDSHFSISEIIAGGKLWVESIEEYLKEGNSEHAAKFASSALGRFLPEELKKDLKTRVETAGKKRMDDYVEKLKNVDSGVATGMIEKRLLNKDTPQQKLEAAALFMMEKYGTLYAKGPLYKYKGSMLWYKAFGGDVNDKLYKEQQDEHDGFDVNFIEDHLVFMLIKRQCNPKGYNGMFRRTRLHKEYKAVRNKAKESEWAKGKEDAGSHRTIEGRYRYAIGELTSGNYPNAMGAMEVVFGKGGNLKLINALPIIVAFSGAGYSMDQEILDRLKNKTLGAGMMVPTAALLSKKAHMGTFNDTILELSHDLEDLHPKECFGMAVKAEEIYSHIHDVNHEGDGNNSKGQWNEPKKLEETIAFYERYGSYLTGSLNQLNSGKDKHAKSNKILQIRQDEYYDENEKDQSKRKKPGKNVYREYLELSGGMVDELGKFTDESFMMESIGGLGASGLDIYKATKEVLYQDQGGGFRNKNIGPMVWKEIYTQIDSITKGDITYVESNAEEDKKQKAKILKRMLRGLVAGLLETHGTRDSAFFSLNKPTSPFSSRFEKWGIQTKEIASLGMSAEKMLDINDSKANMLLNRYVENMLTGKDCSGAEINDIIQNTENEVDKKLSLPTKQKKYDDMIQEDSDITQADDYNDKEDI